MASPTGKIPLPASVDEPEPELDPPPQEMKLTATNNKTRDFMNNPFSRNVANSLNQDLKKIIFFQPTKSVSSFLCLKLLAILIRQDYLNGLSS